MDTSRKNPGLYRACAKPGCPTPTLGVYCEKHQPEHRTQKLRRKSADYQRLYKTSRYLQRRMLFMGANPVCPCGELATELDHIVPHRGNQACSSMRRIGKRFVSAVMILKLQKKMEDSATPEGDKECFRKFIGERAGVICVKTSSIAILGLFFKKGAVKCQNR